MAANNRKYDFLGHFFYFQKAVDFSPHFSKGFFYVIILKEAFINVSLPQWGSETHNKKGQVFS